MWFSDGKILVQRDVVQRWKKWWAREMWFRDGKIVGQRDVVGRWQNSRAEICGSEMAK